MEREERIPQLPSPVPRADACGYVFLECGALLDRARPHSLCLSADNSRHRTKLPRNTLTIPTEAPGKLQTRLHLHPLLNHVYP